MPVWLNLVRMEAAVPDLDPHSVVAHLLWRLVLGGGDALKVRPFGLLVGRLERLAEVLSECLLPSSQFQLPTGGPVGRV